MYIYMYICIICSHCDYKGMQGDIVKLDLPLFQAPIFGATHCRLPRCRYEPNLCSSFSALGFVRFLRKKVLWASESSAA